MSGTVRVDGAVLRQRILDLGLSDRALAAAAGTGQATVRSMTQDDALVGHVTVAVLRRLLDETGLTAGDLLDGPDTGHEAPSDGGDTALLAQLLLGDPRAHPRERLAYALGWTLDRLAAAVDAAGAALAPAGLRVHENTAGMVALRRTDDRAADALRRLQRARDHDDGVDNGDARLLYAVLTGELAGGDVRHGDRPKLATLHRQGVLEIEEGGTATGGRVRLSAAAAYAFDVD